MGTLANSEDPDKGCIMRHFIRICTKIKLIFRERERNANFFEIITCEPSMDHPDFIVHVCGCMENSIGLKRVKYACIMHQLFVTTQPKTQPPPNHGAGGGGGIVE